MEHPHTHFYRHFTLSTAESRLIYEVGGGGPETGDIPPETKEETDDPEAEPVDNKEGAEERADKLIDITGEELEKAEKEELGTEFKILRTAIDANSEKKDIPQKIRDRISVAIEAKFPGEDTSITDLALSSVQDDKDAIKFGLMAEGEDQPIAIITIDAAGNVSINEDNTIESLPDKPEDGDEETKKIPDEDEGSPEDGKEDDESGKETTDEKPAEGTESMLSGKALETYQDMVDNRPELADLVDDMMAKIPNAAQEGSAIVDFVDKKASKLINPLRTLLADPRRGPMIKQWVSGAKNLPPQMLKELRQAEGPMMAMIDGLNQGEIRLVQQYFNIEGQPQTVRDTFDNLPQGGPPIVALIVAIVKLIEMLGNKFGREKNGEKSPDKPSEELAEKKEKLKANEDRIKEIDEEIGSAEKSLDEVRDKIKGISDKDSEEFKDLQRQEEELEQKIKDLNEEKTKLKEENEQLEEDISELEEKAEKEDDKEEGPEDLGGLEENKRSARAMEALGLDMDLLDNMSTKIEDGNFVVMNEDGDVVATVNFDDDGKIKGLPDIPSSSKLKEVTELARSDAKKVKERTDATLKQLGIDPGKMKLLKVSVSDDKSQVTVSTIKGDELATVTFDDSGEVEQTTTTGNVDEALNDFEGDVDKENKGKALTAVADLIGVEDFEFDESVDLDDQIDTLISKLEGKQGKEDDDLYLKGDDLCAVKDDTVVLADFRLTLDSGKPETALYRLSNMDNADFSETKSESSEKFTELLRESVPKNGEWISGEVAFGDDSSYEYKIDADDNIYRRDPGENYEIFSEKNGDWNPVDGGGKLA